MKTTSDIRHELDVTIIETTRISNIIKDNPERKDTLYVTKNGHIHPEWTFDDALISYVSKKMCLEWVLSIK